MIKELSIYSIVILIIIIGMAKPSTEICINDSLISSQASDEEVQKDYQDCINKK